MSTIDTIQNRWGATALVVGPEVSAMAYKAFGGIETLFARLAASGQKTRTRKALAMLSDHQLRDIGVTRDEAMREASRPLWY